MAKKNVFVIFDYENDRNYKDILAAWDANPNFEFSFNDMSSAEIDTDSIDRIKAVLTTKIRAATYSLVIVGKYANTRHRKATEIGFINWINFEVYQSKDDGNKMAAVKIHRDNNLPQEFAGEGFWWISDFSQENVIKVLNSAA